MSRLTPSLEHDLLLRSVFASRHHRLCMDPKTQRSYRSTLDHSSPQLLRGLLSGRRHSASRRERGTFSRARRAYPTQPTSWHGATPECLPQGSDALSHPSTRAQNHRRVRERSSPLVHLPGRNGTAPCREHPAFSSEERKAPTTGKYCPPWCTRGSARECGSLQRMEERASHRHLCLMRGMGTSVRHIAHSGEELLDGLDEILHRYDALRHSRGQCLISSPLIAHKLK